jgi:hypothetical protein
MSDARTTTPQALLSKLKTKRVFFLLTKIKNHNNIIIDSSEKSLIKD